MRLAWIFLYGLLGVGCTAPFTDKESQAAPLLAWSFADSAAELRQLSCPEGVTFTRPTSLSIHAKPIEKGPRSAYADRLKDLDFVGAWHLHASDPSFGGLSGLEVLRSGSLLAVSDAGAFIQIGIDPESGAPDGFGSIAYMLDANGRHLSGKRRGDAEGLTYREGLALVSFERDHRVEAFNLEGCGAAARSAEVTALPDRIEGRRIGENRGGEALSLEQDSLFVGFEQRINNHAVTVQVMQDDVDIASRRLVNSPFMLTGTDYHAESQQRAYLYRWYRPGIGNRLVIELTNRDGEDERAYTLAPPMPVDNFEGIAFGRSPENKLRLWIISDDNFNPDSQRTLLFAFDVGD